VMNKLIAGGIPIGLVVSAVVIRTLASVFFISSFCPDEYYQSVEIAHNLVFGYRDVLFRPPPLRCV
jgi:hypothetical protein